MSNPATILAINALRQAQTHCLRGHEFTEENTRLRPNGNRCCKQCNRDRMARNWIRRQDELDGIVDEVALERASRGDVAVYERLTKKEHTALVKMIVDYEDLPAIPRLRDAVFAARQRRKNRNG